MAGQIFRSSEHVDHVHRLPQVGERPHDGLAEDPLSDKRRVHGQNPVAARLQVRGHVKGRLPRARLAAEHGDRARLTQDSREARVVVDEMTLHVPLILSRTRQRREDLAAERAHAPSTKPVDDSERFGVTRACLGHDADETVGQEHTGLETEARRGFRAPRS